MPQKKTAPIKPFTKQDGIRWDFVEKDINLGFVRKFPGDDGSWTAADGSICFREYCKGSARIREIDYGYKIARDVSAC